MPRQVRKPSYLLHKATNRGRVRIDGRDVYLDGPYGSQESLDHYDQVCRDWLLRQDPKRCRLTIDELAILYTEFADGYYVKNGRSTSEANNVRVALRPLVTQFGRMRAAEFGPSKLKALRDAMIREGYVRTSINRMVGRIKRAFRWAVGEELLPPEGYTRLAAISGLRRGRSAAVESVAVKPVPEESVRAIEPHVSRQVWAMIQLQILTGARPGELVIMRGCGLDTSEAIWEYRPGQHKTEHHSRGRVIMIGPRAQAVLREFTRSNANEFLFAPADARAEFQRKRRSARKTRVQPSQRDRRMANPSKQPGERYTVSSYGQAIRKACKRAGIIHWHPHQLRHSAATTIRREAGLDVARSVLGHSTVKMTEIYAERDTAAAKQVISRIG